MADVTDVQNTLAGIIATAIYPNGTGAGSVTGAPTRIYPGWPMSAKLDADLAAGKVNVSVFANRTERNSTRYPRDLRVIAHPASQLTATVAGTVITLGGTVASHGAVMLIIDGKSYAYGIQPGATLASVATALAQLVNQTRAAISVGPAITVTGANSITVKCSVPGLLGREIRRQDRHFMISIWAPSPDLRTVTAKLIDPALAVLDWLVLPDTSLGRIIYASSMDFDTGQKSLEYRRDLNYAVDFATIMPVAGYEVLQTQAGWSTLYGPYPNSPGPTEITHEPFVG